MNQIEESQEPTELLTYQTEDGRTRAEVRVQDETVWLTQKRMAELSQKDVRTISEHIQSIFAEGELSADSVIRKFRITADDGKSYDTQHCGHDGLLKLTGRELLTHAGTVSHEQALAKAQLEYDKHRAAHIDERSRVESHFEQAMKLLPKRSSVEEERP